MARTFGFCFAALLLVIAGARGATAQEDDGRVWFDVPQLPVAEAVKRLAHQAERPVLFRAENVANLEANAVTGYFSVREALQSLFFKTPLRGELAKGGAIVVTLRDADKGDDVPGKNLKKSLLVGAASTLIGSGAAAQEEARDSTRPELVPEEIVVTARRREEAVSDVPLSIQVLTGRELSRLGAINFSDYARTVAGVQFEDRGAGRWTVSMRGVSTGGDVDTGKESTVAIYFDETPISEGSSQPDLRLFDIDRIEVLRGPQGTLFGSGSLSGALRIIPNQPNLERAEGDLEWQLSSTQHGGLNYLVNGMANLPLSEKVAFRAVGYHIDNHGFLTNGFSGEDDVNDERTSGGRLSLLFQPSDQLSMTLSGSFQESHFDTYYQVTDHLPELIIDEDAPEPFDDRQSVASFKVNYDFEAATLTSVTSWYDRRRYFENDVNFFTAFFGVPDALSPLTYTAENLTQELRLASAGGDSFEWVVGAFFQDRSEEAHQTGSPAGEPIPPPGEQLFFVNRFTDTRQYALFGEGVYDLTPTVALTAGVRMSVIEGDKTSINDGLLFGGHSVKTATSRDEPATPRFMVSYKPVESAQLYAQAAKGFRIGGSNPGLPPCSVSPGCVVDVGDTFESDATWNYELGIKLQALDEALSVDASVFYIDWTDIQVNVARGDGTNGFLNAGSAESKGVELAGSAAVNDHFRLGGQYTYTRGELTELAQGVAEQDIAQVGDRLPQVPRISTSGWAELGTGFGDNGWLYLRGDVQYVGERYSNFSSSNPRELESYTLVNLRLGMDVGPFTGALFVNNLTDERANLSDTFYEGVHDGEPYSWLRRNINVPRTIGLVIKRRF